MLQLDYNSVLFSKERIRLLILASQPQRRGLNLSWLPPFICLSPSSLDPDANWAGQEGDVFVSHEVITPVHGSSFILISWLQSPSAVILEPRKIKSDTVSTVSPSIFHEADDTTLRQKVKRNSKAS